LKYLPNKTRVKLYLFSLNSHFPSHLWYWVFHMYL
jgi:hypothetical protein